MFQRLTLIALALSLSCVVLAQAPPEAPSQEPTKTPAHIEHLIAMPATTSTEKHMVIGKITLTALVSPGVKADTVLFYIDDKEVGKLTELPYRFEWDTTSVDDGEHTAMWSAVSSDGQELATGSTILAISNKSMPGKPSTPDEPQSNPPTKPQPSVEPARPPVTPIKKDKIAPKPESEFVKYTNEAYDISIEHPADWSVKDQSSGLAKGWKGGYWLVISTDPVADAKLVVNVRHRMLDKEHTADSFAKFTPYVASWTQSVINGRPAFSITAGSPANKRVVHRLMLLDGQHLWMINCIDTSGKPAAESNALFLRMVQTLSPASQTKDTPAETPAGEQPE